MNNRPKCKIKNCDNLVDVNYQKNNKIYYKQLCHKHRYLKYQITNRKKALRHYYRNREQYKKYRKMYYQKHKKEIYNKLLIWRKENPEKLKQYNKKYYQSHRKKCLQRGSSYIKNRLKTDTLFRLLYNLRSRVNKAVKNNYKKSRTTLELLGCTIPELKQHLQKQFKKGMNWKNYGKGKKKWHIDHIKQCSIFDLSKLKEQRKCFHYTNLRPLWAKENLSRKKKI